MTQQEEWQGALPIRRSDGIYRRIAFRGRRMELHGGRPFILIHGMDVTEQHEAEEALHLATRQRELILESVGDGIYGIDLEGSLTFINEAGARMLGYEAEELTGRDIHEIARQSHADGTHYSKTTNPRRMRRTRPCACATKSSGVMTARFPWSTGQPVDQTASSPAWWWRFRTCRNAPPDKMKTNLFHGEPRIAYAGHASRITGTGLFLEP